MMLFQFNADGRDELQVWSEWPGDFSYNCGRDLVTGFRDNLFWGPYGFKNPAYIVGQWNHLAFTKDNTTGIQRIYVNGKAVAEYKNAVYEKMTALTSGTTDFFTIGAWRYSGGTGGYFNGIIDDFRVYKRALSAEEVLQAYLNAAGSIEQPLLSQAEVVKDNRVNFKDFAVMAARWMEEPLLWPDN
jgi:hypothetical protein